MAKIFRNIVILLCFFFPSLLSAEAVTYYVASLKSYIIVDGDFKQKTSIKCTTNIVACNVMSEALEVPLKELYVPDRYYIAKLVPISTGSVDKLESKIKF